MLRKCTCGGILMVLRQCQGINGKKLPQPCQHTTSCDTCAARGVAYGSHHKEDHGPFFHTEREALKAMESLKHGAVPSES